MTKRDPLRQLRGLLTVLVCVVVGAGVSFAVTAKQHRTYTATAESYPNSSDQAAITDEQIASYAAIARSLPVMRAVVDALHLVETPHALSAQIQASVVSGTTLIALTASSRSPVRAAEIANAAAASLARVVRQLANGSALVQVQQAIVPKSPSAPRRGRDLAVGALLGLLCGIVALLSYRWTSISKPTARE
jgi:succinoglycan biosynthesis transport protein ExoP